MMKSRTLANALLCVSMLHAAAAQSADPPSPAPGYQLVWSDEFNGSPGGLPDSSKWSYEEGFVRNGEEQYYTKRRPANARVEDGTLIIEARKEDFANTSGKGPATAAYTSASLITLGKASWHYGRIEVRAKLPQGRGVWPAIWTLGENRPEVRWPRCGEIDLLETIRDNLRIRGNFHYAKDGRHVSSDGGSVVIPTATSDFHIYTLEWNKDRIELSADGRPYAAFDVEKATDNGTNPFRLPHYLILNLALGGAIGGPIDDSIFPQQMVVDYVRVYQKTATGRDD